MQALVNNPIPQARLPLTTGSQPAPKKVNPQATVPSTTLEGLWKTYEATGSLNFGYDTSNNDGLEKYVQKHLRGQCADGEHNQNLVSALSGNKKGPLMMASLYTVLKNKGQLEDFQAGLRSDFTRHMGPFANLAIWFSTALLETGSKILGLEGKLEQIEAKAQSSELKPLAAKLIQDSPTGDEMVDRMIGAVAEHGYVTDSVQGPSMVALALKAGHIDDAKAQDLLSKETLAPTDSQGRYLTGVKEVDTRRVSSIPETRIAA